jgi:nicotinamide mononucleotide (NMN) deamidase PncC
MFAEVMLDVTVLLARAVVALQATSGTTGSSSSSSTSPVSHLCMAVHVQSQQVVRQYNRLQQQHQPSESLLYCCACAKPAGDDPVQQAAAGDKAVQQSTASDVAVQLLNMMMRQYNRQRQPRQYDS